MALHPGQTLNKYEKIIEIAYKSFERVFARKQTLIKGSLQLKQIYKLIVLYIQNKTKCPIDARNTANAPANVC